MFSSTRLCLALILQFFITLNCCHAQLDSLIQKYANSISYECIKNHVYTLSSEEMRGRQIEDRGLDSAANYISEQFQKIELPSFNGCNNYYQNINLLKTNFGKDNIYFDGEKLFKPFLYCGKYNRDSLSTKLIYVGDASNKDLKDVYIGENSVSFISTGLIDSYEKMKRINSLYGTKRFIVILPYKNIPFYKQEKVLEYSDYNNFYRFFDQRFDLIVLDIESTYLKTYDKYSDVFIHEYFKPEDDFSAVYTYGSYYSRKQGYKIMYDKKYKELLKLSKLNKTSEKNLFLDFQQYDLKYDIDYKVKLDTVKTQNVVGYIKGASKPEESIILTAHYDGQGFTSSGNLCPGADDNATGVAALIEIAKAFKKAEKDGVVPDRTIIFLALTAEEDGYLGSRYYVDNPLFPIDKTILNINIDMIGRNKKDTSSYSNTALFFTNGKLKNKCKRSAKEVNNYISNFKLVQTPKNFIEFMWPRLSDHYQFKKKKVSIAYCYSGFHKDIHTPRDTPEKINYDKTTRFSKLAFGVIWKIANMD